MKAKLVELTRLENPVIAETLRIALEDRGIAAFIESSETNRAMHYVGTALGGVRVLVPSDRKEEAEELLRTFSEHSASDRSPGWICPNCGEEVDAGFEACWSCDTERPEGAAAIPPPKVWVNELGEDPTEDLPPVLSTDPNPYSSPRTSKMGTMAPDASAAEVEAMVLRAWRASVIGLFLCPVLLHAYSMVVLIDTRDSVSLLSQTGQRRRLWATIINWIMVGIGIAFVFVNVVDMWRVSRY